MQNVKPVIDGISGLLKIYMQKARILLQIHIHIEGEEDFQIPCCGTDMFEKGGCLSYAG